MNRVKKFYFKQIAIILAFTFLIIGSIPAKSMAYVIGADSIETAQGARAADIDRIQRVLESKLVSQKLESMGLTKAEIKSRVEKLSDQEVHSFASQLDHLYPGGDGFGIIIALLIIVILVLVILKLMDRKIIIK